MTEKDEANRFYKLMYVIIMDKQDAKDCAIVVAQEKMSATQLMGTFEFWNGVIDEIKKM